jgi:nucleotide-binding universal stress UspA family protein
MNYRHVMVPLDGSELAECVLPHLEAVASNCQITTVELVRAVPPPEARYTTVGFPVSEKREAVAYEVEVKEAEDYLLKVKGRLDASRMNVITQVLRGKTADVLTDHIKKSEADLLLMATHGRSGPSRWYWGSVADKLLRSSCTPVFMVRAPGCVPDSK